ncbi:MAG: hypothetical protein ACPGLY_23315, partial [Rubripirellula sp.]
SVAVARAIGFDCTSLITPTLITPTLITGHGCQIQPVTGRSQGNGLDHASRFLNFPKLSVPAGLTNPGTGLEVLAGCYWPITPAFRP